MNNKITLKDVVFEDFLNYKKPSMFLIFPTCDFKCCKEAGCNICQNMDIIKQPNLSVDVQDLINKYLDNPITKAVVCGGLEPLDSLEDLYYFIESFRAVCDDDIVIYTGYRNSEISTVVQYLKQYKGIILKYGRFIPGQKEHFDDVLGINLVNDEQYAERIS